MAQFNLQKPMSTLQLLQDGTLAVIRKATNREEEHRHIHHLRHSNSKHSSVLRQQTPARRSPTRHPERHGRRHPAEMLHMCPSMHDSIALIQSQDHSSQG
jgi:hypothetical protein